jgi:hypothetical protein
LIIWIASLQALQFDWWVPLGLFLLFALSAYVSQLVQEPTIWSGGWLAFPRAFVAAFWRIGFLEATANLLLAVVLLGAAAWMVLKIWGVDIGWLLALYGLATSIQCMHWRRIASDDTTYAMMPIFLTLLRDLIASFRYLRQRNRNWTDEHPLQRNATLLDNARRDPTSAGQGSEHL